MCFQFCLKITPLYHKDWGLVPAGLGGGGQQDGGVGPSLNKKSKHCNNRLYHFHVSKPFNLICYASKLLDFSVKARNVYQHELS